MRKSIQNEVKIIKRATSFLLTLILLLGMLAVVPQAGAAEKQAGIVTTAGSRLNVRSGGWATAPISASLPNGSYVTLVGKAGPWWHVQYGKGQYGYCHENYITTASASSATVATNSGSLNVRSGPGTSYARTASLAKGQSVLVLSTANGWSRILYHGTKTGYVSAQYLSTGAAGYSAVSLSVPSFKQTDSRWANVPIGASGKTMAKIGCATTAIAMLESHRLGYTVYPDAMSKKLSYTSSGSVYWPSHYTTVTSSDSLSAIYSLLSQGKPVLYGAKNSYGSQHWVVITGFTGGSLTAGNFTIHDPGSNSRTTLQQFLSAYPTFYKYFHY